MFLLGFFNRSLWSVLSEETNESPSHKFPFWWCSVFLRQTEQNLSPHFWHWEWPSCVFDKLEGDVHFGQGRSLTTVWLDNGCRHTEVLGDLSTWSPLSFRGMLTLILLSGSFDRFLTDIVLLPWFSCGEKTNKCTVKLPKQATGLYLSPHFKNHILYFLDQHHQHLFQAYSRGTRVYFAAYSLLNTVIIKLSKVSILQSLVWQPYSTF